MNCNQTNTKTVEYKLHEELKQCQHPLYAEKVIDFLVQCCQTMPFLEQAILSKKKLSDCFEYIEYFAMVKLIPQYLTSCALNPNKHQMNNRRQYLAVSGEISDEEVFEAAVNFYIISDEDIKMIQTSANNAVDQLTKRTHNANLKEKKKGETDSKASSAKAAVSVQNKKEKENGRQLSFF